MKKIKKYILTFIIFLLGGNLIMANSVNNLSITKKENLLYIFIILNFMKLEIKYKKPLFFKRGFFYSYSTRVILYLIVVQSVTLR